QDSQSTSEASGNNIVSSNQKSSGRPTLNLGLPGAQESGASDNFETDKNVQFDDTVAYASPEPSVSFSNEKPSNVNVNNSSPSVSEPGQEQLKEIKSQLEMVKTEFESLASEQLSA